MIAPALSASRPSTDEGPVRLPRRILMSVDAVGGVWRYAMDLAEALRKAGIETVFAGFGPAPSMAQSREAARIGRLEWLATPLDWMADDESALKSAADGLGELSLRHSVDLMHLNLPSQAAGLALQVPVVTVSHSCVATWFEAVRKSGLPEAWLWQKRRNRLGFDRSDVVLAPSWSHAAALERCYGPIDNLAVAYNSSREQPVTIPKQDFVFAAGRWWDEGKNGAVLDRAAAAIRWPVVMAGACSGPNGQHLAIAQADHRGELSHERVMALMSSAAVVVSPSIYEPFGLAPLEAAGAGAALVLADIATYRELWDGAARFFDPRDPEALADAVNDLTRDAAHRAELGRSARSRSQCFTIEAQRDRVLDAYSLAMQKSSRLTAAE
ncbi:glycosyltransferase family 4 protein [Sinorhizobium americanum]|uniref:Glycosyltransferase involved in cell wall biosynthesis n=1 Tax=Sinorhizobium americanum TaxID=194963 RepID=A0A4V2REE7_9HYPH|nr:glycosyltransferase family 4 protein [Sinorhizobium americanum]TCN28440.1 glycosyltransferase involved in cell wall biosynthesis [Sinorhizobium americanum]